MLSLGGIKSFVFARQASSRCNFSVRLTVQKQAFYSPGTKHGCQVIKVYYIRAQNKTAHCYVLIRKNNKKIILSWSLGNLCKLYITDHSGKKSINFIIAKCE